MNWNVMKRRIQIFAGLIIGVVMVWWLFRGTEWGKVFTAIRQCDLRLLIISEILLLLTFVTRVQRWVYIVRSTKPVPWMSLFSATQIGFLGNFVLPARAGEIIRAVVLARLASMPVSKCIAFVALDRVTDLIGLMAMMFIAALAFRPEGDLHLPPEILASPIPADAIRTSALLTTIALVGIIAGFVLVYLNKRLVLRLNDGIAGLVGKKLAAKTHVLIEHFAEGMHVFRSGVDMALATFYSLLTWLVGAGFYILILYAFGMSPPWYTAFVVMALLAIAISLPGPPGFVGPFHIGIVGSVLLTMPETDLDIAKAAAILAHLLNMGTVCLVGVYCLYREKFGLLELRREGEHRDEDGSGDDAGSDDDTTPDDDDKKRDDDDDTKPDDDDTKSDNDDTKSDEPR